MKYILTVFILLPSLYTLNFARYSWNKKSRLAAFGSVFLAIISIALPLVLIFTR